MIPKKKRKIEGMQSKHILWADIRKGWREIVLKEKKNEGKRRE